MRIKLIAQLLLIILTLMCAIAEADMVILKSGELFQTKKAWKEKGQVSFYQNNHIVHIKENDVERLIQTSSSANNARKPPDQTSVDHSKPVFQKATTDASPPPLPDNDDAGHLDLKWGAAVSQIDGLEPIGTDPAYGGVALYALTKKGRFGRAQVDRIHLGFWQGKLYTITVWTSNFLDFRELKAEAFRRYGDGLQKRKNTEKFHWVEDSSDRLLSYDFESDTGYLWMRSTMVHQLVEDRHPK